MGISNSTKGKDLAFPRFLILDEVETSVSPRQAQRASIFKSAFDMAEQVANEEARTTTDDTTLREEIEEGGEETARVSLYAASNFTKTEPTRV